MTTSLGETEPFVGELRAFPYNFCPAGWHVCDGTIFLIEDYGALYYILGNTFGGSLQDKNFAIPDLRGRTIVGGYIDGSVSYPLPGTKGGSEHVTLNIDEIPAHNHNVKVSSGPANSLLTANSVPYFADFNSGVVNSGEVDGYTLSINNHATLNSDSLLSYGGSQPHENRMPYLTINWCIAMTGFILPRD